jgi:hypothetical protein
MKLNKKTVLEAPRTAEGAIASRISPELQLRRSVLTHMLWENAHYVDGEEITNRISSLVPKVKAETVSALAIEAREVQKLRHVPLFLTREMAKLDSHKKLVANTLQAVIQRPDELTEFLAMYWKDGRCPLSNQVKKGLARAFTKFNGYQLAKYNQNKDVKLKDVLFLSHAKPIDQKQAELWKQLINNTLKVPDTWEVELSNGKGQHKKESWERLLTQNKLGALALLRNLRNMESAGVDDSLIREALCNCNPERVLPFRFISAAKHAPKFEPELEKLMFRCVSTYNKLQGKTIIVIDVSGSMGCAVSSRSELRRLESACAIAMLVRELSDEIVIYATAGSDSSRLHDTRLIPARRGFALSSEILKAAHTLGGGGIFLKQMLDYVYLKEKVAERIIVISDSQDCDINDNRDPQKANAFGKFNYLNDISCERNGIAYNKFMVINGFSESLINFILEHENLENGFNGIS